MICCLTKSYEGGFYVRLDSQINIIYKLSLLVYTNVLSDSI